MNRRQNKSCKQGFYLVFQAQDESTKIQNDGKKDESPKTVITYQALELRRFTDLSETPDEPIDLVLIFSVHDHLLREIHVR